MAMFQAARREDYEKIIHDARALQDGLNAEESSSPAEMAKFKSQLSKLQGKYNEITAVDYFSVPERSAAETLLAQLNSRLKGIRHDRRRRSAN